MATVRIQNVRKTYGSVVSVDDVSLDIKHGELVTLLGSSGCGKTTTLRIVAGLIEEDSGDVLIDDKRMRGVPPWKRNIGFVFQNYALFPHLTIFDNIAYGLKLRKLKKGDMKARVHQAAEMVEIAGLLDRYPQQLSGGQQQRCALARALAIDPAVLLMDEPLSGLDAKLRERVQYELKEVQRKSNITTIYVTHDQQEAFALADTVVVMNNGGIEQIDTPSGIYNNPKTPFAATFIGSSNQFEGHIAEVEPSDGKVAIRAGDLLLRADYKEGFRAGDKVSVVIRTNRIRLNDNDDVRPGNAIPCEMLRASFSGTHWKLVLGAGGLELKADLAGDRMSGRLQPSTRIEARIASQDVWYFH